MAEVAPMSNQDLNAHDGYIDSTPSVSRYARALRKIALGLSLSTLTVLVAVMVILIAFPFRYKWEAKEDAIVFVIWMSTIVVFCLINSLAKVPTLINTIADFVFTYGIISCLIGFMGEFPHYEWCYDWGMTTPVHPQCVQWRLVVTILMGVSSGFAIILDALFVLLLLHRIYALFMFKNGNTMSMRLPNGEISLTVIFKVTRQDDDGVIQEARSAPTGQGPVHL